MSSKVLLKYYFGAKATFHIDSVLVWKRAHPRVSKTVNIVISNAWYVEETNLKDISK